MKQVIFILICLVSIAFAQQSNDACSSPNSLCSGTSFSGSTSGATANSGEDGINGSVCFSFEKTVWYNFTTNASGGNALVNVTNVTCTGSGNNLSGIIYRPGTACSPSTYTVVSNCETGSTVGFSLTANALAPNTTYYVLITSGKDCSFDIQATGSAINTTVNPTITITDDAGGTICEQTPVTFTATTTECTNPRYNWTINGTTVATTTLDTYTTNQLANGDVVQVNLECGCGGPVLSNGITMSTYSNVANAGPDVLIPLGGSTVLQGSGGNNPVWSPTIGLSSTNAYNPTASPIYTTTYVLTVSDGNGCTFTDSMTVTIIDSITVPNTFTPNGDGANDTWEILRIESFPDAKITVYDRWGQEVYKTIGYPPSKRWDGTRGGKKLPASTYYYIINLSATGSNDKLVAGSVTIVY